MEQEKRLTLNEHDDDDDDLFSCFMYLKMPSDQSKCERLGWVRLILPLRNVLCSSRAGELYVISDITET